MNASKPNQLQVARVPNCLPTMKYLISAGELHFEF